MSSKTWEELWWVSFVVLGVWIVNGALIIYLLTQIDSIVNVQLYNFGLQFSNQWANPYWASSRLVMVFLIVPMALSATVFVLGFRRFRKKAATLLSKRKAEQTQVEPSQVEAPEVPVEEKLTVTPEEQQLNPQPESEPESEEESELVSEPKLEVTQPEMIQEEQVYREAEKVEVEEPPAKEDMGLLISCPNCNKVFNQPLVMLDFSSGTTRLVNICPFCNHILGEALDSKKNDEEAQQ
jgi:hypothetical protein